MHRASCFLLHDMDIEIKMGEFGTAKDPDDLTAVGVGSCVVVSLYDPLRRIGGLAHTSHSDASELIDNLLVKMRALGASRETLEAKLAGGSNMFDSYPDTLTVGGKNIHAAREKLEKERIRIFSSSVGGTHGSSIEFSTRTGMMVVKVML